jgi:PAS domain S-box-containing protein
MHLDVEADVHEIRNRGCLGILRVLGLLSLVIAVIISALFFGIDEEKHPSPTRIALRINHNITAAHLWAQDCFRGETGHDRQEISLLFDRAAGYVKVALEGGEIDGVTISPLESSDLQKEMREIGLHVEQMRGMTFDLLTKSSEIPISGEFHHRFDALYLDLINHTTRFAISSRQFVEQHKRRFQVLQITLVILAIGFSTAILAISTMADRAKKKVWSLLRQVEERRKLAIDGANLGTWDWNIVTGAITLNERWWKMLDLAPDEIEPNMESWKKLVHPDDLPWVIADQENHLQGNTPGVNREYRLRNRSGQWIWVLELGKALEWDAGGNPIRAAGTHLDITELKMAEFTLRREKERAQRYLDLAGVMFVALDNRGEVTLINRKGCQILGLPEEEILGRNWMENFIPERYRAEIQDIADHLLTEEADPQEYFENPILTASGSEALIVWHNSSLLDDQGNTIGILSSGTDITEQRNHENALEEYRIRLQSLASRLAVTEDHLRQEIAAGLHDSIGQNLAAVKLAVDLIRLKQDDAGALDISEAEKDLEQVSLTIDSIVNEVWSLSFQLSPPGLYEAGIVSALDWLISRFNEQYSCVFGLTTDDQPLPDDRDSRGLMFQMIRELMINAVKHGGATSVEIALAGEEGFIQARVTDNGVGFDVDSAMTATGQAAGFGLFSIRERLAFISGKLDIESTQGRGTEVTIHFPLENTPV